MKFEKLAQNTVKKKTFDKLLPEYLKFLGKKLGFKKSAKVKEGTFKLLPYKSDFGGWILQTKYLVLKVIPYTYNSNKEYKNITISMYSTYPEASNVNNRCGFNNTKSLAYFINNQDNSLRHLNLLLQEPKVIRLIEKYELTPKQRQLIKHTKSDEEFETLYIALDKYLDKLFKPYLRYYRHNVHSLLMTQYKTLMCLKGDLAKRAERLGLVDRKKKVKPREEILPIIKYKTFFSFAKPVRKKDKEKMFGFYHYYDKKNGLLYRAASQTCSVVVYDAPYKEYKKIMKIAKENKYAGQLEFARLKVINFVLFSK